MPGTVTSGNDAPSGTGDIGAIDLKSSVMSDVDNNTYDLGAEHNDITKKLLNMTKTDPVTVTFNKLTMSIQIKEKSKGFCRGRSEASMKTILAGINGVFEAGKFTAIMGASGAGKTTLLNAVAGEAAGGLLSGSIQLNGGSVDSDTMRKLTAFVFQDDVILSTMTVREAITMSATLRLPRSMSLEEKLERVEQVIKILHLERCRDTIIGNAGQYGGVSGGERKRCSIAMELITNPSVLFLDEPTSGLDTFTAYSVCETLKQLAQSGRTVVATIHQPSSEVFSLFDNLLVLARGQVLYQGPASDSISYFAELGFPCPAYTNPSDYLFMHILNDSDVQSTGSNKGDKPIPEMPAAPAALGEKSSAAAAAVAAATAAATGVNGQTPAQARVQALLMHYAQSPRYAEVQAITMRPGEGVRADSVASSASFFTQLSVLFGRAGRNAIRNRLIIRAKLGQSIFMGLLVGLIYFQLKSNQRSVQDRTGALFFVAVNCTMAATFGVISAFGPERIVFERERSHGMYSTLAYFISKVLVELPHNVVFPVVQATIAYWIIGLQPFADKWVIFVFAVVLVNLAGTAMGIMIACIFPNIEVTLAIAPLFIFPLMLFSGFFINQDAIPVYFQWIKWLSPMKYTFGVFAINEFTGLTLHCDDGEYQRQASCGAQLDQFNRTQIDPNNSSQILYKACHCPITDGQQVLKQLGFDQGPDMGGNMACIIGLWGGFLLLAFTLLHRLVASKESARAKLLSNQPPSM